MDNAKKKLACYLACGCGGCDTAILDTDLKILELSERMDIVFWPTAVDLKEKDVEAMPDGSIDLCLFNGSIRNQENEDMALLLRKKSVALVAFGTCAATGGIHGLLNTTDAEAVKETVYAEVPSIGDENLAMPACKTAVKGGELTLPELFDTTRSLDQVVEVDYYVPGCPPSVPRIIEVIDAYLGGQLPEKGSVLGAANKPLCDTCPRTANQNKVAVFTRPHLIVPDEQTCLLEQGIICLGPITRSGCGESCIRVNMPCTGCYGPVPGIIDAGGAMTGKLAALMEYDANGSVKSAAASVNDPIGSFYMYTMAKSLLKKVSKK